MDIENKLKLLTQELKGDYKVKEALKNYTTIKIGGQASIFWIAKTQDDLVKIIKKVQALEIPYLVIGYGSNIVVSDEGFVGLVIKNETSNLVYEQNEAIVDAGINLNHLIRILAESNLGGLEFLSGIPGTIGGAVYGNAGAFGKSMSNVVNGVVILDSRGEIIKIDNQEIEFGYRTTILKEKSVKNKYSAPVILSVRLRLHPSTKEGILRVVQNYTKIRIKKQPNKPSCGSVFRNIILANHPNLPHPVKLAAIEGKVPAGLLLERAGVKGLKYGGMMVSKEHANFIINRGRGKARDFKILAEECKNRVRKIFGVGLDEEIEYIGEIDTSKKGILERYF